MKDAAKYAATLTRVKKRYEQVYYGSIFLALRKQKAPINRTLKAEGAEAAMVQVYNMQSQPLARALRRMYNTIGPYEAEREYQRLKRYAKGFGEPSFDWLADIADFFDRYVLDQVRRAMLAVTQQRVMRVLQEGIATGQSIDDMVQALKDTEFDRNRARLIVRTEVNRGMNYGHNIAVKRVPFPVVKVWMSANDFRVRGTDGEDKADHRHMNGMRVPYDQAFKDPRSGAMLMFPGDTSLGARAADVCNCRCVVVHEPM